MMSKIDPNADIYFDVNGNYSRAFYELTEFPIYRNSPGGAWYYTNDDTEGWKYVHPHMSFLVSDHIRGLAILLRM